MKGVVFHPHLESQKFLTHAVNGREKVGNRADSPFLHYSTYMKFISLKTGDIRTLSIFSLEGYAWNLDYVTVNSQERLLYTRTVRFPCLWAGYLANNHRPHVEAPLLWAPKAVC